MPNLYTNRPDKDEYVEYIAPTKRVTIYDKESKCYKLTDEGKELLFDELIQYLGQKEDTLQYLREQTLREGIKWHDWRR